MKKLFISSVLALILILSGLEAPTRTENLKISGALTLKSELTASTTIMAAYYDTNDAFVSEIYESEFPFQLLGLTWTQNLPKGTAANILMRFRSLDGEWSAWQHIQEDEDAGPDGDNLHSYIMTATSTAFQYKATLSTSNRYYTPKLANLSFDYVNGGGTSLYLKLKRMVFTDENDVVSRGNWGADESLRLSKRTTQPGDDVSLSSEDGSEADKGEHLTDGDPDMEIVKTVTTDANGDKLLWPLQYPKKVKKIIVHHTATNKVADDPEASVRAIYYYHAVSRGWGDIGYNYVIDQNGRVYEGRYGGDGVVAGHAYGYNTGSLGIALLGNYQSNEIPAPMVKSLTGLIYEKAELNKIDPDASGLFRGEVLPNIIGHRDVGSTVCPGANAYDYIPEIRKVLGDALDARRHTNLNAEYSYEEAGRRELVTLDPQSSATVRVSIKNTGTATWNNSTYLKASAGGSDSNVLSVAQARMNEVSVGPGKTATFDLTLASASYGGLVNYDLSPVFNGTKKVLNYLDLAAFVSRPILEFDVSSSKIDSSILKPEADAAVTVKLKNTGNITWTNSGENAITLSRTGTSSLVSTDTLAALKEANVAPGSTGTFEFKITAPKKGGKYSLYYAPSMDNSNAFVRGSGTVSVTVMPTNADAEIIETSDDLTFTPGEKKSFWLVIANYSDKTWKSSELTFGLTKNTAIAVSTPKLALKSLAPGISSRVSFSITAPSRTGNYSIYIRPRVNGANVMTEPYILKMKVNGIADAAYIGHKADYTTPIRIKLTPDKPITPIISADSAFSLYDNQTLLKNFSSGSRVRVAQNGTKFDVSSGAYSYSISGPVRLTPDSGGIMQIITMDQRPAWNTTLNDNRFRGTIEVRNVDGEMTLINEVALEDYMKGIGEVSNGDPTEKIKTMMVIARTYAKYYLSAEKFPGKPYNLDDDPNSSQKYLGYGFELRSPNVSAAAVSTAGEVVTYGGKTVITPYFTATDGTRTKSAQSVWGWTNTPWLVSVSDSLCATSSSFQGHGVGLSGCGATAMANSGKTYLDIIRYYYSGVDVQKI